MFSPIPFLSYVLIVVFTPGPNTIMSMVNANKYGYLNTLKFISGVFIGFIITMLISSYFNLLLFNIMPKFKLFMGVLGAAYMIYIALKIMTSKGVTDKKESKSLNLFITGLTMQFVNPKVILFGITVMSNFIIPYYNSNGSLILFSFILASFAVLSNLSWAFFGVIFQKFLSKYNKPFNIIMGLLLIYSALSILGIK